MSKGFLYRVLEVLERWMYRLPNHVVAVGNGYKDNILQKARIDDRISVVTNGVDKELFSPRPPSETFLKQYDLSGRFVCSYVGTIGMAHGLEVTVRAAELLKEMNEDRIAFCLIGEGASRERLQKEVKEKGLEHWIRFTGRLPKQQMPEVLASSDCLLIHLKKTDLFQTVIPSKIFEAMAMEKPLIMAVRGEAAEIVENSKAGINIEPENEQQLIDNLLQLSSDSEVYRSYCENGRKFVLENYSRDVLAEKMLDSIKAVVGR
jgi:glycosyltransferase involved in cell wall biosynthesis